MMNNYKNLKYNLDNQVRIFGEKFHDVCDNTIVIYNKNYDNTYEIIKHFVESSISKFYIVNNQHTLNSFTHDFSDVNISFVNDEVTSDFLNNKIVILYNQTFNFCLNVSEKCREAKSCKLFITNFSGLSGFVFVDAGSNPHKKILNDNSEPILIGSLNNDGLLSCVHGTNHCFNNNDKIVFNFVEGINVDFLKEKTWSVEVISKELFKINGFKSNGDFTFLNGSVKKEIDCELFEFESFERQGIKSNRKIVNSDEKLSNDIIDMHFLLILKDEYPYVNPWSSKMSSRLEYLDFSEDIKPLARSFGTVIQPISQIFLSLICSEVLKVLTNKFSPIKQWYTWHDSSLLENEFDCSMGSSKLENLMGTEFVRKLNNLEVTIFGYDSLGINLSNLLLYSRVGINSKINVVVNESFDHKKLNDKLNFLNINLFDGETELRKNKLIYNSTWLSTINDFNVNKILDAECFNNKLGLLIGNCNKLNIVLNSVLPYLSDTFENTYVYVPEKVDMECTIRNYPNQTRHLLEWTKRLFEHQFFTIPKNINKFRSNPDFIDDLSDTEQNQAKLDILEYVNNPLNTFDDCLEYSVNLFHKKFIFDINQLLTSLPKNHLNSDDTHFWSGGKKCPSSIDYDLSNDTVYDFIIFTSKLLAESSNIQDVIILEKSRMIEKIKQIKPKTVEIVKGLKVATNDSELKLEENSDENIVIDKDKVLSILKNDFNFINLEERNDDIIEFIKNGMNLRGINYNIDTINSFKVEEILYKIKPIFSVTSSLCSGFMVLELMKGLINKRKLSNHFNYNINLEENQFMKKNIKEANILKINGKEFNSWEKFCYNEDKTLQDFIDNYSNEFGCSINMVLYKSTILFMPFVNKSNLNKKISDIFSNKFNLNLAESSVMLTIDCMEDIELPSIEILL